MVPSSQAQTIAGSDAPGEIPARKPGAAVPPRTPYEEAVVAIWSDLLGRSDFGVHDDFFELGGHSLLAPKVVARIRKTLGVAIPVKDFFESPTPAALAATVAAQSSATPRVVTPRPPDAGPVLSFDQQRLWLENQLLPGAAYNIHGRRRLTGPVDVAALEASIRAILLRHEALRTRFPLVDDAPVQVVDDLADDWRLPFEDLRGDPDPAGTAGRLADEQAATPFDLAAGPLLRCLLIRVDDTCHVLAVTMHHIVSDAWSIGLFVRELVALYEAGGDVEKAGLAPLPVQYRDYAVWQRDHLAGEILDREVAYWRQHLDGAPAALTLPAARRHAVARRSGDRVRAALPAQETDALHELCRKHGVSPFMALLAALSTVLGRWSGQRDVVVGVPIAGRTDAGTDLLVGFFVNTLPIRVDLSGDPSFAEVLRRVRQVALDGYAHAEAPVDVIVERLQATRDPRRTPLFEVILNVIGSPEAERISGVAVEAMDAPTLPSKFDLVCNAQEIDGVLQLHLDFNADRFDAPMMQILLSQVESLLRAAVADPARALLDYRLEPATTAPAPYPAPVTGGGPAPAPGRIAVVDADGEWTYEWLGRAAGLIAGRLPGAAGVGVVRRPTAGFVAAVLGCLRAGVPYSVIEADSPVAPQYLGVSSVLDVADETIDLSELPPPTPDGPPAADDWAAGRLGLTGDDRFAPLSARPGLLNSAIVSALASGGTLYLPPPGLDDPGAWLRAHEITVAYLSPPQLRALRGPLPALRHGIVDNAGDLIAHDVEALRRISPGSRFTAVYRPGRDGRPLAVHTVPQDWRPATAALRVPLGVEPHGEPAALVHPGGQPASVGEVAELRFGDHRTGDLARRWNDGTLEFVARLGASLTADPLETLAALRDVPGVTDAVVTELLDDEDEAVLVGYVTGVDPEQAAVIRRNLVLRLPEYLIPRHLFVVDTLERTPDGEYDLAALPFPDEAGETADAYVAPRTPMERRLAEIFEELLGVRRVGIHDTFFELNGFSLLATTLTARIRDEFHVELSLREVFGAPTVESLTLLVLSRQGELSGAEELEAILDEIGEAR